MSALKRKNDQKKKQANHEKNIKLDLGDKKALERERYERFSNNKQEVDRQEQLTRRSLNEQFRSIEERRQELNRSIDQKREFLKECNDMRQKDNDVNRSAQKMLLDSIKERIWRKHKRFQQRRSRHMQIITPPSTFDIYMQSSQLWNPNRGFAGSAQSSLNKSTTNALNIKNPLADMSLRDAMNSSYSNYFTSKSQTRKSKAKNQTFLTQPTQ